MSNVHDIRVCIWDVDGTLYPPMTEIQMGVREAEYRVLESHTQLPRERIIEIFDSIYPSTSSSSTQAVANYLHLPAGQIAQEMDEHYDRRTFLTRDERLVDVFRSLSGYSHYILGNGGKKGIVETLIHLGLSEDIFQEIVTAEIAGENKPGLSGFTYILNKTGLPAKQHMMIGDRVVVDLDPAASLGIRTCLVWVPGQADLVLPNVYEVVAALQT